MLDLSARLSQLSPFLWHYCSGTGSGIWFKPAGGYSAVAVEHIIAGVILFLVPHLHPPPTRQNDIYRVPCSGLWPWKPSLLLNAQPTLPAPQHVSRIAEHVGMENPQGRAEWLTDLCAWSALTQNMVMWPTRGFLHRWPTEPQIQICFCCVLLCHRLFFSILFNIHVFSSQMMMYSFYYYPATKSHNPH